MRGMMRGMSCSLHPTEDDEDSLVFFLHLQFSSILLFLWPHCGFSRINTGQDKMWLVSGHPAFDVEIFSNLKEITAIGKNFLVFSFLVLNARPHLSHALTSVNGDPFRSCFLIPLRDLKRGACWLSWEESFCKSQLTPPFPVLFPIFLFLLFASFLLLLASLLCSYSSLRQSIDQLPREPPKSARLDETEDQDPAEGSRPTTRSGR